LHDEWKCQRFLVSLVSGGPGELAGYFEQEVQALMSLR